MTEIEAHEDYIVLYRGEPSGAFGPIRCQYQAGQCLRHPNNRNLILAVVRESSRFVSEDGMSLGVGDHEGWIHTALCREATQEEIDLFLQQERLEQSEHELKLATIEAWQHLRDILHSKGDQPRSSDDEPINVLVQSVLRNTLTPRGGEVFAIDDDGYIWHLKSTSQGQTAETGNARFETSVLEGFRGPIEMVKLELSPLEVRLLNIGGQGN